MVVMLLSWRYVATPAIRRLPLVQQPTWSLPHRNRCYDRGCRRHNGLTAVPVRSPTMTRREAAHHVDSTGRAQTAQEARAPQLMQVARES